jgi:hypothetical protein
MPAKNVTAALRVSKVGACCRPGESPDVGRNPARASEIRPGCTIDFRMAGQPVLVNLQGLVGFALYGGNKPQSFKDQVAKEGVFVAPMVFVGWRF